MDLKILNDSDLKKVSGGNSKKIFKKLIYPIKNAKRVVFYGKFINDCIKANEVDPSSMSPEELEYASKYFKNMFPRSELASSIITGTLKIFKK